MRSSALALPAVVLAALALGGCGKKETTNPTIVDGDADTDTDADSDTDTDADTDADTDTRIEDYWQPGPRDVIETEVPFSNAGCDTPTLRYAPDGGPPTDTVAVVLHGMARKGEFFADWGRQLASWGVPTLVMDQCHSLPNDNDPQQDALDAVARANDEGAGRRIYIGHSAGALRAVLAADADADSVAVVTMDLVDLDGAAAEAQYGLAVPLLGLFGEPSSCNEEGAGTGVLTTSFATSLKVLEADHCDFEAPTNALCFATCARPSTQPEEEIRRTIHGMVTAAAVWQSEIDPSGREYWEVGGSVLDQLVSDGAIEVLP